MMLHIVMYSIGKDRYKLDLRILRSSIWRMVSPVEFQLLVVDGHCFRKFSVRVLY